MRSLLRDPSGYRVGVLHKIVIRNSKNRYSHSRKFGIARLVALTAEIVGASVQLDREPGRIAIKIENEVARDLLPAEVQSVALAATESVPEHMLRAGGSSYDGAIWRIEASQVRPAGHGRLVRAAWLKPCDLAPAPFAKGKENA